MEHTNRKPVAISITRTEDQPEPNYLQLIYDIVVSYRPEWNWSYFTTVFGAYVFDNLTGSNVFVNVNNIGMHLMSNDVIFRFDPKMFKNEVKKVHWWGLNM